MPPKQLAACSATIWLLPCCATLSVRSRAWQQYPSAPQQDMWQQHGNDPKTSMPCLVLSLALNRLQSDMLPAGQHNDLATAMLSSPVDTVRRIFSLGHEQSADICAGHSPCYFTLRSLAVLFPTFLILMALTGGLAVPGGLFVPSILVKSCSALHLVCPSHLPGGHALLSSLESPCLCSAFGQSQPLHRHEVHVRHLCGICNWMPSSLPPVHGGEAVHPQCTSCSSSG